jgi:diacylglycerol O-acyltransferase / wax synthase
MSTTEDELTPLAPEDCAILEVESATIAGHTCKVMRLSAGAPDVAALRDRIAERIHLAPALTRRLDVTRDTPCWCADPAFDVDDHIAEHRHEDPVDQDQLLRCVARLFEQRLDRSRPLWHMDVIELQSSERVIVWRIHHALADGTTAMRYARALLWDDAPELTMSTAAKRTQHAADEERRRRHLAGYLRREYKRSKATSPFDGTIGTRRAVGFATVPLRALHDAARRIDGATLNDAVLTVVAGSLRGWLELHHGHLDNLRVKVPVSLHHEGDAEANRDSSFSLGLPISEPDPVKRLHTIHVRTKRRKEAHDAERREVFLHHLEGVSPRLERYAKQLERSPRRFALNVSNVPGPREPVSVIQARLLQLHSLAEVAQRHALRISVISLADTLGFGFCADADLVPDVPSMAAQVEPEAIALIDALTYR